MIYLFNQLEELIDVIDEASLAEFTHTIELNQFDRSSFEIPVDYKPEIIKEAQFFGFQSRDRAFCLFRISEKSYDIGLTIEGIDRAESDLHSFIIEDKRPGGTASDVLREILEGTGYQLGNVDGLTRTGKLSFYYISVRQALVKIIESYVCEFKIRYTFVENKIIGRYIDLNQRFGRVTGHQFEYGSNILNVTYEESSDDVVTALIGRGKGEESTNESGEATGRYGRRIQFKDVSWSVSKGDPVDKPAGQNYVTNEAARNIYGLHQNGVIKHRFGVYTNEDIEDPVELLKATYNELQRLSVPIVTFKANLLDLVNAIEQDVWVGDSVGIVRDQIGIAFGARIHKLIIDKLDDNRSVAELGDYQTLQAKDRSTRQQALKDAIGGFSESSIRQAIVAEVERRDKEFDEKIRVNKLEFDNELQRAKERAEEVKHQLSDVIDQRFDSFNNGPLQEVKRRAEEALRNAGAISLLAQEAKRISLDSLAKLEAFKSQATSAQTALSGDLDALKQTVTSEVNQASEYRRTTTEALSRMTGQMDGFATKSEIRQDVAGLTETFAKLKTDTNNLISGAKSEITLAKTEFKKTADGLSAKMSAVESYVGQDGQRQEALRKYTREESARQATAVREHISRDYVGKNTFQESVQGVEKRLESLSLGTSGNLLKNSNDGFYNQHNKRYRLVETLQANQTYTLVTKYWNGENATGHTFFDGVDWRRLDYNQAIDAWMVQFTPTKEIPAGTEITLSSDPADSKGNMDWATLVRGAIPLIHWQPAKGDVEEGVRQKLAEYKETVDGRFATISSQINGKANQSDFQRVKETSQLYERIIGRNENDISNKVARMALTNQLFQVEVGKYASQGGPNLIKNSGNPQDNKNWGYWEIGQTPKLNVASHSFFYNEKRKLFSLTNNTKIGIPASTIRFPLKRNTNYTVALTAFNTWNMKGATIYFLGRKSGENQSFSKVITLVENVKFSSDEAVRKNYIFNSGECDEGFIRIDNNGTNDGQVAILLFGDVDVYEGASTRPWQPSPEDAVADANAKLEATQTKMTQLAGSWSVQNLTSAGAIVSQINATNNQILIEAEKIRLKGKTLLDELTAIDGYFKRLFVGEGEFAKLNAEIIGSKTITADKLIMDQAMARMFVSSDIFTDTLAAKEAFINKLRSVVVTATLLEGYKGRIGGFQIGTHEKDSSVYWITGQNQFSVGMSNGTGQWSQTALWVNWGNNWAYPGDYAWYVKNNGKMYCYNTAEFWNTPVIHGDLRVTGHIFYNNKNSGKSGYWIHSSKYSNFEPSNDYLYLYYSGSGYDWIPMNKEISDRRYKHNIEDSTVSGLDVVESLKTYSYRKEYDGKIEDISCGIMAQDVQKYAPEAFFENPDGAYSYNTFALVPYLIKAIQELNQKIEKLEKTV